MVLLPCVQPEENGADDGDPSTRGQNEPISIVEMVKVSTTHAIQIYFEGSTYEAAGIEIINPARLLSRARQNGKVACYACVPKPHRRSGVSEIFILRCARL
eukprot:1752944-Pleurochrysis_carterae.AAC.4